MTVHLRAVLFDFDGILVDSETVHFEGIAEVARRLLGVEVDRSLYDEVLIGFDDQGAFRYLAGQADSDLISRCVEEKESLIADRLHTAPLIDGADRVYRAALRGYHTAIVSGALRREIEDLLTYHGLPRPPVLVAAGETDAGKPDPEPYIRALELLRDRCGEQGCAPLHAGHCVVFEDTAAGIAAGRAAGMWVCRLATGAPAPEPDAPQPHLTFASWSEVDLDALPILLESKGVQA